MGNAGKSRSLLWRPQRVGLLCPRLSMTSSTVVVGTLQVSHLMRSLSAVSNGGHGPQLRSVLHPWALYGVLGQFWRRPYPPSVAWSFISPVWRGGSVGQGARFLYSFALRRSIIGSDEQLWEPQLLRPIPRPRPSRRWRKAVRLVCTPLRRSPTRRLCARRELRVGSLRGRFASREQICE